MNGHGCGEREGSPQSAAGEPSAEGGEPPPTAGRLCIRAATVDDGAALWCLVRDSGALDLNSPYCYLLLSHFFGDTTLVAEEPAPAAGADDTPPRLLGFVAALRLPPRPESIFVWQIGVAAEARGRGLASRLLDRLVEREASAGARFLEATVTPGNGPSRALFRSLARRHGTGCEIAPCFEAAHFPAAAGDDAAGHEAEELFRIGPLEGVAGAPAINDPESND